MSQSGTYDINAVIISTEYLVGDNGLAVGPDAVGNINLLGGNNITTTGTPGTSTMTIDLTGTTQYAVQVGDATGSLDSLAVGATGEGLMGNTGANPGWTGSPSFSGTVTAGTGMNIIVGDLLLGNGDIALVNTDNNTDGAIIGFAKSRSGGIITTGDYLGEIGFAGWDGASLIEGVGIKALSRGTIGVNRVPARMEFYTHPDAVAGTPSVRMWITEHGNIFIHAPDAGEGLTVGGGGMSVAGTTTLVSLTSGVMQTGVTGIVSSTPITQYALVVGNAISSISSLAVGATNQVLLGNTGANPSWGAVDLTAAITGILPVANGGTGIASPTDHSLVVGSGAAAMTALGVAGNGQIPIGSAAADPVLANITSTDDSITVTNGAGTIDLSGNGIPWVNVTGATQAMAVNTGYIANRVAGNVAFTLPAAAAVGDVLAVAGSQNGWTIAQNAGQTIHFLGTDTTTGVGGSLASTIRYNCVELVCIVADTDFVMRTSAGNITVT